MAIKVSQNMPFSSFKRVSSLDHLQLLAKSNATQATAVREQIRQIEGEEKERAEKAAKLKRSEASNNADVGGAASAIVLRPASMTG